MEKVSLSDKPNKKVGRWKDKKYTLQLLEYTDQSLREDEKNVYNSFFNAMVEKYDLKEANDLMLLDIACYDFIRIKRIQSIIMKEGDVIQIKLRTGQTITKSHEASYLLNAVEGQFRSTMKELMLTRKEITKKEIGMGSVDFANFLNAKTITGESEVVDDEKTV